MVIADVSFVQWFLIVLYWAVMIVAAVKTAQNRRWGLFVLGLFCQIAWIVGWATGPQFRPPRPGEVPPPY